MQVGLRTFRRLFFMDIQQWRVSESQNFKELSHQNPKRSMASLNLNLRVNLWHFQYLSSPGMTSPWPCKLWFNLRQHEQYLQLCTCTLTYPIVVMIVGGTDLAPLPPTPLTLFLAGLSGQALLIFPLQVIIMGPNGLPDFVSDCIVSDVVFVWDDANSFQSISSQWPAISSGCPLSMSKFRRRTRVPRQSGSPWVSMRLIFELREIFLSLQITQMVFSLIELPSFVQFWTVL